MKKLIFFLFLIAGQGLAATATFTPTSTVTNTVTATPTKVNTPTIRTGVRVRTTPGAADVLVSSIPQSQVVGLYDAANWNLGVGVDALGTTCVGTANTAYGYSALKAIDTGSVNTGIGKQALMNITTGWSNTAVGVDALASLTTSSSNTALGLDAMQSLIYGASNSSCGSDSMGSITHGEYNTAMGHSAGRGVFAPVTQMNYCSYLGYRARTEVDNLNNSSAIGYDACVTVSNQVVIGNAAVTQTVLRSPDSNNLRSSGPATFQSAFYMGVTTVSSTPYTITASDSFVYLDATSAGITVQLPSAVGNGRVLNLKKVDTSGNSVVFKAASGETIDGSAAVTIGTPYAAIGLQDGASTKWWVH